MANCEEVMQEPDHLTFCEVNKDTPEFQHVEDYFNSNIAFLYGDQSKALKKIAAHKDRNCELLQSRDEDLGIIVYKDSLTQEFKDIGHENAFEIKTLFVINPKANAGKKIAMRLIHRIAQLAVHTKAASVFVTVSSAKPESLAFFLGRGFRIEKISKDAYIEGLNEYYLFHPSPEKLLSSTSLELLVPIASRSRLQLNPTPTESLSFTPQEKFVLSSYFQGKNSHKIIQDIYAYFGFKVSTQFELNTIANLRKLNLKWRCENLPSHYTILFVNPLYADKNKDFLVGQLLIGVSPLGKRYVLGCFPAIRLPQSHWIGIFEDLKILAKIKKVDIFSASPRINISTAVHHTFPLAKFVSSENLKSWVSEDLLPKSSASKLVKELLALQDLATIRPYKLEPLVSSM